MVAVVEYVTFFWAFIVPTWALCPLNCLCPDSALTNCSSVNLTFIPQDIDPNVEVLDLSWNEIPEFNFPVDLPYLKIVNLSCNLLTKAEFPPSLNVEKIDLSGNMLTDVRNVHIATLSSLSHLDLSSNRKLGQVKPMESQSLQILDLSFSHVLSFEVDFLQKLPNLCSLIIANNSVKSLAHLHSKSLKFLDVSHCEISHLTSNNLGHFPELIELNVANNRNLRLSLEGTCLALKIADFSSTGQSEISVSSLCDLEYVNFAYNSIRNIEESTFRHNLQLKNLNISFNNLAYISKNAFRNNSKIKILDVSNNQLCQVDWTIYLKEVQILNLSSNNLERLDDFLLLEVENLDLSSNKIGSLEIPIADFFPKIQSLNLRYNLIEYIQPMTSDTLKYLKLGFCQISILNENTFRQLKNLNFLDLEGNKLKRLDYQTLKKIPLLTDVQLGRNPWTCNCKSEQFNQLLTYLLFNKSLTSPSSLRCDEIGDTWLEVCPPSGFEPNKPSNTQTLIVVGIIFVLALAATVGIIFFKAWQRKRLSENQEPSLAVVQTTPPSPPIRLVLGRSQSVVDVYNPSSNPRNSATNHPPPSYEEALLLPPLSETERMTRSMGVLNSR